MNKQYPIIDILKFSSAILIVFMHTYCRDFGQYGQLFVDTICTIGVPFFFITSGFFYSKGLKRNNALIEKKEYFRKYVTRIIKMYVSWSIITIPITILIIQRAHPDYSLYLKFIYLIRLFFFVGSIGIYWYILALIYNSYILYQCQKKNYLQILFVFSIIMWAIGVIYNSPYLNELILFKIVHAIFGSERNFLMVGLFYMIIGFYFEKHESKIKFNNNLLIFLFITSIIIRIIEATLINTNFTHVLEAILLFMIGINYFPKKDLNTLYYRELSTGIYLLHFPFILLFDFYLINGTFIDFFSALIFSIVTIFLTKKYFPKNIYKTLFG